jgi:uncharacterized protein (DUF2252 family)
MIVGYEEALVNPDSKRKPSGKDTAPIRFVLKQALKRKWRHLAEERIEDVKPSIPLGKCFWTLANGEKREISRLFGSGEVRKLITSLRQRKNKSRVEVVDASYWMKGCSSLGRLRYAVLAQVGGRKKNDFCLIDIKEAIHAAAPTVPDVKMPRDHAERVVTGARALSPFLGERMIAAELMGKPVVLRELLPQDLKLEMDRLTRDEIVASARFLAAVVGKAHSRQMDTPERNSWMSEQAKFSMRPLFHSCVGTGNTSRASSQCWEPRLAHTCSSGRLHRKSKTLNVLAEKNRSSGRGVRRRSS